MKFSESWLREWINPSIPTDELVAQLTMAGLEVDSVASVAADFHGVVVGEVLQVERHPDADKLSVCQVAGSPEGTLQVVCGAPNVRPGLKVPFALIGAHLGEDFRIKKAKLRGVESNGMLCGADELGVDVEGDGLWELPDHAPVGEDLRQYLQLDDRVIEVDLTPNRGDCLSIQGLAREVSVLNEMSFAAEPLLLREGATVAATAPDRLAIEVQAPQDCPRYLGRVVRNIDAGAQTPLWMAEKLRRCGLRPLHPVVDVTNYVLLELGQPMHAFDLSKVEGGIIVRHARENERLTLLDGSEATLRSDTLVIADQQCALAMAGVMGGNDSAVDEGTRDIFLESAFFAPLAVAGKARSYGVHTDSSHRFERGVDPQLCIQAMERATQLLLEIVGGEAGPIEEVSAAEHLPAPGVVTLRRHRLDQQLGFALPDERVTAILTQLGLQLVESSPAEWQWQVPSWRFDLAIEQDLIEELARIHGYDNLPVGVPLAPMNLPARPEGRLQPARLRDALVSQGYREVITYSFVDPKVQRLFEPDVEGIQLANPISADMAVMRTSLWPGLVKALQHNLNRQQSRAQFFEIGSRFVLQDGEIQQVKVLSMLLCGTRHPESWAAGDEQVDFFDLKGDLEVLLGLGGQPGEFRFTAGQHSALHPGQTAVVSTVRDGNDAPAGVLGRLHPQLQQALSISKPVYLCEVELEALLGAQLPAFVDLSRYPEVRRDLAFVVDADVSSAELAQVIRENAGSFLTDLKIFDVYQGKGVETNRKSIAFGLTFQNPSRTLTESEVTEAIDAVVSQLKRQFAANLRG